MADGTIKAGAKKANAATAAAASPKTGGLTTPVTPAPQLAAIVGKEPVPHSEIVSRMWVYSKKHQLQDATDRRQIDADGELERVSARSASACWR